jgi:PII-like signaling protein
MQSPMRVERPRVQLTLYIAEPHLHDRRSKLDQLVRRAAAAGLSGSTVLQACQGFGRRHSHEASMWKSPDETPLTVIFVDSDERIDAVLALLDEILPDAVAVAERVRAVRYIRPHTH